MAEGTTPPVMNPHEDVGQELARLVEETGAVRESMGGYKISVYHNGAFPWQDVFKTLLYRDFKVAVTRYKADLFIEAQP